MKQDKWRDEWHMCDTTMMKSLSAITETPGQLFQMDISALNINLQNMQGVQSVYLSGYVIPQEVIPQDLTPVGEFVLLRTDDDKRKAYNYAFALSGNQVYFNGPYKYFSSHHTPLTASLPIDNCFGHIPRQPNKTPAQPTPAPYSSPAAGSESGEA